MAMIMQDVKNFDFPYIEAINENICDFLSEENLNKLKGIMHMKTVNEGTHLFWEGEEVNKIYFLKSGRVKIKTSSGSGKDFLLAIKNEGSLIGEFSCNENLSYQYRAEVVETSEIGVIFTQDLKKLLYQFGNFAVEFMSWIGWSQRIMQNKLYDLLFYDKTGALASTLLKLTTAHGVKCKDGILIAIELTNKDLGDFIGLTRESVNRILNAWKREGIIEFVNKQIFIRDIDDLYNICDCDGTHIH